MTEKIPATLDKFSVPIDAVSPVKGNPRRGNIEAIAESLDRNGQYRPIVVNKRTQGILAGNHTYAAAKRLGWERIAVTFVDVDEDQAARIVLADNRTADLGRYDDDALLALLRRFDEDGLVGSGYTKDDVDLIAVDDAAGMTLDDLSEKYGEMSGDDLLSSVTLRVSMVTLSGWHAYRDACASDDAALSALLGLPAHE